MYTHEQKISHLKALYHLALSDGILSKSETVYIRIVADALGVSIKELDNYDGAEQDLILPDREYKMYSLFHRYAIMIMVDDLVHEKEERNCFNLGIKMGLHPNAIEEIINHVMMKSSNSSPQEIIAIFRKYMN
jgi:DnaJ-domain-containing protein 1